MYLIETLVRLLTLSYILVQLIDKEQIHISKQNDLIFVLDVRILLENNLHLRKHLMNFEICLILISLGQLT